MKALPHPIQYQGSKRNLAPIILRYFPKGINRLVEPFAGSAAISVAAAAQGFEIAFGGKINDNSIYREKILSRKLQVIPLLDGAFKK